MDPKEESLVKQRVPGDGFCVWSSIASSVFCALRADSHGEWGRGRLKRYAGLVMAAAGKVLALQGSDSDPFFFDADVTPFPIHAYGAVLEEAGLELVKAEKTAPRIYDTYADKIRQLYGGAPLATGSYRWHQMGRLDLDAACIGLGLDSYFFYDTTVLDDFFVVRRSTPQGEADDLVLCDPARREEQEKEWAACAEAISQLIGRAGLVPPRRRQFGIFHDGAHYSGLAPAEFGVAGDAPFQQGATANLSRPLPRRIVRRRGLGRRPSRSQGSRRLARHNRLARR